VFRFPLFKIRRSGSRSVLWKNADFLHLWAAESVSQFGSQISLLAIPLIAALSLDATPLEMGILGAAGGLPRLILGFLIGPWVDHHNKRKIMIVTDIGRAIVLLAIPMGWWLDVLTIPILIAVAVLIGVLTVMFNTAYSAIVPVLVERKHLGDAHSKLMASVSLAQTMGPAIAGGLVSLFSASMVTLLNAATYLWSGWFIRGITRPEPEPAADEVKHHFRKEIMDGFRVLVASPILKATTTTSVLISLTGNMFLAVYVLYMTDDLGLSSTGVGLVYASGGVGALIGTTVSGWLVRRIGVGGTIVWGAVACGAFGATVPMAVLIPQYALPLIVFAEFFQWMLLTVHDVNRIALRQALTPNRLQGRIAAATNALYGGAQTAGLLLGGVIGDLAGVRAALIVGIVGMFVASYFVWASPTRVQFSMPEEPDPLFAAI
jgi:MFS family permease